MGGFIFSLILLIVLIGAIFLIRNGLQAQKEMKNKAKDIGAEDVLWGAHIEGLGLALNTPCEIYRLSDRILIDAKSNKFEIKYSQIRAAVVKNERELIEKGKSVVGRALIGTLLVPGLGTIVGGMSGIGTKKKNGPLNHYLIFNYTSSSGELSAVTFQNNMSFKMQAFCDAVNNAIPQSSEAIQL